MVVNGGSRSRRRRCRTAVAASLAFLTVTAGLLGTTAAQAPASAQPMRIIAGWFMSNAAVAGIVANAAVIGEVSPFWFDARSRAAGLVIVPKPAAGDAATRAGIRDQLRAAGILVLPSIVDATPARTMASTLADPAARAAHIASIVSLVLAEGYDGIDIDYEQFAFADGRASWPTTQPVWTAFVVELAAALHAQGKLLSITTPPSGTRISDYWVYNWPGIAADIDRLRIMTYEYSTTRPGPIAPLGWTTEALRYAVSVVPASKVAVGIPTYGRDWLTATTGTCPVGPEAAAAQVSRRVWRSNEAWATIATLRANPAVSMPEPTTDPTHGERTVTYTQTLTGALADGTPAQCTLQRTAWWVDQAGYLARVALVGQFGLRGTAVWTLGNEEAGTLAALAASAAPPGGGTQGGASAGGVAVTFTAARTTSAGTDLTVPVTATLNGAPLPGYPLSAQVRRPGSGEQWTQAVTATTGADGIARLPVRVSAPVALRIVSPGTATAAALQTEPVMVSVDRAARLRARSSEVRPGRGIVLRGAVTPAAGGRVSGAPPMLQERRAGGWRDVDAVAVDGAGRFTLTIPSPAPGLHRYRVRVDRAEGWGAATSQVVRVTVGP